MEYVGEDASFVHRDIGVVDVEIAAVFGDVSLVGWIEEVFTFRHPVSTLPSSEFVSTGAVVVVFGFGHSEDVIKTFGEEEILSSFMRIQDRFLDCNRDGVAPTRSSEPRYVPLSSWEIKRYVHVIVFIFVSSR